MKQFTSSKRQQHGAVLVVGLIMLVLITVMVTSSFTLSSGNLKAVANTQFRQEAVAAANKAVEQVLSSPFSTAPAAEEIEVDINNDGNKDYLVQFAAPDCVSSTTIASGAVPPSSSALGGAFNAAANKYHETIWDIGATVSDIGISNNGASAEVHQGVRVLLTDAQYLAVCS